MASKSRHNLCRSRRRSQDRRCTSDLKTDWRDGGLTVRARCSHQTNNAKTEEDTACLPVSQFNVKPIVKNIRKFESAFQNSKKGHAVHEPPQSMPLSSPFSMPSLQVGPTRALSSLCCETLRAKILRDLCSQKKPQMETERHTAEAIHGQSFFPLPKRCAGSH